MPTRLPFPSSEAQLNIYFLQVVPYLIEEAERLQIAPSKLDKLTPIFEEWKIIFPKSRDKSIRTMTITMEKNNLMHRMIPLLRKIYQDIPESLFTNEDRTTFNLPERKKSRTAPPVPTTVPIAIIDMNNPLQHTIRFFNSGGSKAKPYLCRGCQIWYKIGDKPADVREMNYLATPPKSPFIHHFKGEDVGKKVYYWLRWENTAGVTGPWSNQVVGTITG